MSCMSNVEFYALVSLQQKHSFLNACTVLEDKKLKSETSKDHLAWPIHLCKCVSLKIDFTGQPRAVLKIQI